MGVFKSMEIEKLEALERLATAGERIAAALEAIASANGCRIEAAAAAAAEAAADAVPEQAETPAPAPAPEPKAEQAEKPAAPAKPEAPAADQLDPKALLDSIFARVKAYCETDFMAHKQAVGAIFARYGVKRMSATPEDKAAEISTVLKDELGI